jgi:CPA1 family monovalent cation:H+ antiporter
VSAVLAVVSIVVPLARRWMLPSTLVLGFLGVLIGSLGYLNFGGNGLGQDLVGGLRELGLLDDAFIFVYLPPLLFSAGLTVDIRFILDDIWHVVLLALVAVVVCTLFVGYAVALTTGTALLSCLLLGTIVSPTDTAAVIAVFREVGAPKRLSTIVEGEALFNDAAAIAMFAMLLEMVTSDVAADLWRAASEFLLSLSGGAVFGYAMARLCCGLISTLKDEVTTEVTLTIAFAYFTFVVGSEVLHVSGVVATVTLAIGIGAYGRSRVSPGSWEGLHRVWEHLDFWATSLIFVTSAMYVPRALKVFDWHDLANVGVVFVAALASRAFVIWGLMPTFSAVGASRPLNNSYKVVLWWGGMRGAVTIALVLAAVATDGVSAPVRHLIVSTGVGYVIASLTLNGLTLRPLMNFLRLDRFSDHERAMRDRVLRLARRRIRDELGDVAAVVGRDPDEFSRAMVPIKDRRATRLNDEDGLRIALATWCHHEIDLVLSFRERGILSRHHVDVLRAQADRLLNALKGGTEAYRQEVARSRRLSRLWRLAFRVHRLTQWKVPLVAAIANRMEYLFGEYLVVEELIRQAKADARGFFGKAAEPLLAVLQERADMAEREIHDIEQVYPSLGAAVRDRHLALVALGLVEAEYRRHLSEATISLDVFKDLDDRRRTIAQRFARRPGLEADFGLKAGSARLAFPVLRSIPRSAIVLCFAYPGQDLAAPGDRSAFLILAGQVEIRHGDSRATLGPGEAFAGTELFPGCTTADEAVSTAHTKILRLSESQLRARPRVQTVKTKTRRRRAARSAKPRLRPANPRQAS